VVKTKQTEKRKVTTQFQGCIWETKGKKKNQTKQDSSMGQGGELLDKKGKRKEGGEGGISEKWITGFSAETYLHRQDVTRNKTKKEDARLQRTHIKGKNYTNSRRSSKYEGKKLLVKEPEGKGPKGISRKELRRYKDRGKEKRKGLTTANSIHSVDT